MPDLLLAMDSGGSRTRCLVADRAGRLLAEAAGGASNQLMIERAKAVAALDDTIREALRRAGVERSQVRLLCAGLASVEYDGMGLEDARPIFDELGFPDAALYGDIVIAHWGALAGRPGVLALAGTGSCFLGITTEGRMSKAGGWGAIYGDEGSAYCVACQGLRAAAKGFDGRGPDTALTEAMAAALGVARFEQSVERVYVGRMDVPKVAALAPVVSCAAEGGDAVARDILQQAGRELAAGVRAVMRKLNLESRGVLVSYQGALLTRSPLVRESLAAALEGVEFVPPRFEPIRGAYLLGCQALGWEPSYEI